MTGLLLATLLNLSPGVQLADNVESRHVALSDARLPLLFVSDDEPRPSIDAMTREQLAVELRRLDDTRPSLVGPIVLMSVGGALAIPGAALVISGLSSLSTFASSYAEAISYVLIGFGGVIVTVGAILLLVGVIKLAVRLGARSGHSEETDEVRKRIDALDQAVPVPPPDMVPPPPPPPPQANLVVPGGMRTVMTF